jgi:hypothetical protein
MLCQVQRPDALPHSVTKSAMLTAHPHRVGSVTGMDPVRVTEILIDAAAEVSADSLLAGVCQVVVKQLRGTAVTVAYVGQAVPMDSAASSNEIGRELNALQMDLGDGPDAACARTRDPVSVADLSLQCDQWPMFADAAMIKGVRAVFVFPIASLESIVAVMTLYRGFTGALSNAEASAATSLTEAATQVVLHHGQVEPGAGYHHQPTSARWVQIQQASGMVSVQLNISPADALAVLRAHAYSTEQPLVSVARSVVERTYRFGPPLPADQHTLDSDSEQD